MTKTRVVLLRDLLRGNYKNIKGTDPRLQSGTTAHGTCQHQAARRCTSRAAQGNNACNNARHYAICRGQLIKQEQLLVFPCG